MDTQNTSKPKEQHILVSLILIVAALAIGVYLIRYYHPKAPVATPDDASSAAQSDIQVGYTCADNKGMIATYHTDIGSVDLTLSDDRTMTLGLLAAATATTSATYGYADKSIVFGAEGEAAFLKENTQTTFTNCKAQLSNQNPAAQ